MNRTRNLYKKRRDLLLACLQSSPVGSAIRVRGAEAGLHLLLQLENGLSERQMVERARGEGVAIAGLSSCYSDPSLAPPATVLCGYARFSDDEIRRLAQALSDAWKL